jgi:hypothetical protein
MRAYIDDSGVFKPVVGQIDDADGRALQQPPDVVSRLKSIVRDLQRRQRAQVL